MDYVESFAAHGEALDVYGAFSGKLQEAAAGSEEAADGLLEVDASRVITGSSANSRVALHTSSFIVHHSSFIVHYSS